MELVTFEIEGADGEFACDPAVVRSYKTAKALSKVDEDFGVAFELMEKVFCGRDEEYIDRLGGGVEQIEVLLGAAIEACGAKNSPASPRTSKATGAK